MRERRRQNERALNEYRITNGSMNRIKSNWIEMSRWVGRYFDTINYLISNNNYSRLFEMIRWWKADMLNLCATHSSCQFYNILPISANQSGKKKIRCGYLNIPQSNNANWNFNCRFWRCLNSNRSFKWRLFVIYIK